MYYYFLIMLSVMMFGVNFALNDVYRRTRGSTVKASLEFTLFGSLVGVAVLFIINGISFSVTPFALIMSLIAALNGFAFTFCGFKALGSINLSLYSLFSMLGGMLLPFLQGIVFFNEEITLAKALCFILIVIALIVTVEKGERKNGGIYYVGIFVLNGMSGVITKIYNTAPYDKISSAGYSILQASWSVVISLALILIFFRNTREDKRISKKSIGIAALGGSINRVANFILVFSLNFVENSIQYPMVTGGVIIVSTLICYLDKNKPKKKELLAVALAFVGLLIMFLLPEMMKNI